MRKTLSLAAMLLFAAAAQAAGIGADKARRIATDFFTSHISTLKSTVGLTLAHSAEGYYAFNRANGGGYVIVADTDAADRVLAFSDTGSFDAGNIPPAMAWLLGQLADELRHADPQAIASTNKTAYADIPKLITTKWDQRDPFFNMCPSYTTTKCLTGCVATAMAQIMNYYEYPATGTGSNTVYYNNEGYTVDFSQSTYQWDLMLDEYPITATDEAENAVAKLMYDAGVAANMNYGHLGSSTTNMRGAAALANHFGYAKNMRYIKRDYYDMDEWISTLYTELAAGRPILYGGVTDGNYGHSFILDGYECFENEHYFHVNWGYSGSADGYYMLTALGLGLSSQYNNNQSAVIGIKPSDGTDGTELGRELLLISEIKPIINKVQSDDDVSMSMLDYTVLNVSFEKDLFVFGFKFVPEDGSESTTIETYSSLWIDPDSKTDNYMEAAPNEFPTKNGFYKVYLTFCTYDLGTSTKSNWQDVTINPNAPNQYFQVRIDGNDIYLTTADGTFGDDNPTALPDSPAAAPAPVRYYDLAGRQLARPQRGLNIVVYSDGTAEKVVY